MKCFYRFAAAGVLIAAFASNAGAEDGNPARGQRIFRACAACHSLQPGRNMTGPSLSNLWNRKAGGLPGFTRYSDALKSSDIHWNDNTLDAWIADPQQVIPGNDMTFAGLKDAQQRADLIAFLKQATSDGAKQLAQHDGMMGGGMGGMMGGGQAPNLKKLAPEDRVQAISYCRDTYTVTTTDGKNRKFWERNLRLKTDSSSDGPEKNAPALIGAGMMGDRADVIFADPSEINRFISSKC